MALRIEDYALIGNCETAALVGRDGSIDWLGLPRFDSAACFAALLGNRDNGRWLITPQSTEIRSRRQYRGRTLVLETLFDTPEGTVCVIDFMSGLEDASHLARVVKGVHGSVPMRTELVVRFEYGSVVPWVTRLPDGRLEMIAGPDRLLLSSDVPLHGENMHTVGDFTINAGQELSFTLTWTPSFLPLPEPQPAVPLLERVESFWCQWASRFDPPELWGQAVMRSIVTLKALSHWQTGGIVAAATTSLPEKIGGVRNWDYRLCWLRDATLTLYALMSSGFLEEARAWRLWLLRAAAGQPEGLQIMYGLAGERRLPEYELPWLAGYEGSKPVRVGNAAATQFQLDVYGEVMDALYVARRAGLTGDKPSWALEQALMGHLESIWDQPDEGIWELRGGRRHFTHSKVMAWVAFDRAVRSAEEFGLDGPVERWRAVRDRIHEQVCECGFDKTLNSFVQSYGASCLDASLLLIAIVGFLPVSDSRVRGTVEAIERTLLRDGLVLRYRTEATKDGLPPGEGAFLACTFWLADNYVLLGRAAEARALFEHLLSLRNDVGLLAEEYDPVARRQLGNFPQAFSHLALINTARNLLSIEGPAHQRSEGASSDAS